MVAVRTNFCSEPVSKNKLMLLIILVQKWPSYIKLSIIVSTHVVYNINFFKNYFLIVIISLNNNINTHLNKK